MSGAAAVAAGSERKETAGTGTPQTSGYGCWTSAAALKGWWLQESHLQMQTRPALRKRPLPLLLLSWALLQWGSGQHGVGDAGGGHRWLPLPPPSHSVRRSLPRVCAPPPRSRCCARVGAVLHWRQLAQRTHRCVVGMSVPLRCNCCSAAVAAGKAASAVAAPASAGNAAAVAVRAAAWPVAAAVAAADCMV